MSVKSDTVDKLASALVKQGGKKVGSLLTSIFKSGSKKADDVVETVVKKGSKKVDDVAAVAKRKAKKYVQDKRFAKSDEGLPLYNTQTGQRISVRDPKTGRMTQQVPASGDEGLGIVLKKDVKALNRSESLARMEADRAARKAAKETTGPGRIRYAVNSARLQTPTWAKVAIPVAGVAGLATAAKLSGGSNGYTPEDWQTILGTAGTTGTTGTTGAVEEDPTAAYYKRMNEIANADYLASAMTYPGAEVLDPQSSLSRQYAASTANAMDLLAGQYAQAAGGIKERGQTGAANINDIYAQGASAMDALAAAPSDGMSGMIPVSGEQALAGQYSQAEGQSLADYLSANGLIDAQAAGELAGYLSPMGEAYKSQYNLVDQQARNAATNQKSRLEFESKIRRDEKLRDALSTIALQQAEEARATARYQTNPLDAVQFGIDWEGLNDDEKDAIKAYTGAKTKAEYVKYRLDQKQRETLGL